MHKVVRTLLEAHRKMERVLTLVRFQLDSLNGKDDVAGFRLLKNAVGYMSHYPGLVHHPAEKILFSRLVRHAPDVGALCEHLLAQHRRFGEQESLLLRYLPDARRGDAEARRRLIEIGSEYCTDHAGHIRSEEGDVFPQAERWLQAADWREIGRYTAQVVDPLPTEDRLGRFETLYDYLIATDRDFDRH